MINIERIKRIKRYCCEDITTIENYEKALNDNTQVWEIHHRLEVQDDGTLISAKELIDNGLYFDRPACELIFLTKSDHVRLHNTNRREETRRKIREGNIGKKLTDEAKQKIREYNIGKKHSDETRQKMKDNHKGMLGKKHSTETKQKLKEAWEKRRLSPVSEETKRKRRETMENKKFVKGDDGKYHWIEKNSSVALF